jgi:hypothetical protein
LTLHLVTLKQDRLAFVLCSNILPSNVLLEARYFKLWSEAF